MSIVETEGYRSEDAKETSNAQFRHNQSQDAKRAAITAIGRLFGSPTSSVRTNTLKNPHVRYIKALLD